NGCNFDAGCGLWKSDGTVEGTVLVKGPGPDYEGFGEEFGPSELTNVNGTLFFQACDTEAGCELWKSDGTEAGTVLVKDVDNSLFPTQLTNVNGTLLFDAYDFGDSE